MKELTKYSKYIPGTKKRTELYVIWTGIKQRCYNKNERFFKNYGGRGIKICDRWLIYENFVDDMGERPSSCHSIDRIDNDGDYTPENCRWAMVDVQANNRRSNLVSIIDGKRMTLVQLAKYLDTPYSSIKYWIETRGNSQESINEYRKRKPFIVSKITVNGLTKSLTEWSREFKVSRQWMHQAAKRKGAEAAIIEQWDRAGYSA